MHSSARLPDFSASVFAQLALTIGFILTGTATTMIGPLLPALAARWSLSDARAGQFFLAQFLSSTVGALVSEVLARRFGLKLNLVLGFLLLAIGIGCLSVASAPAALLAVATYGCALGLTIPSINLTIAEIRHDNAASALNVLNLLWTVGALASPLFISTALRHNRLSETLLMIAAASVLIMIVVASVRLPSRISPATEQPANAPASGSAAVWLIFAFVFFLYVGLENAIAGWAAAYAQRIGVAHSIASAALVPAAFWIALLAGRAIFSALMLRTLSPRLAANLGMSLCLLGCITLLLAAAPATMIAGVAFAGFGLAPVYPNAIAHAKQQFSGRNIAPLFACAGAGGAVVPYLVGVASSHASELSSGLRFALLVCCVLTALQFALSRWHQSDGA